MLGEEGVALRGAERSPGVRGEVLARRSGAALLQGAGRLVAPPGARLRRLPARSGRASACAAACLIR